jgi:PAS domain S-box-containing protein
MGHPADLHVVVNNAPLIIWSVDMDGVITMSEGKGLKDAGLMPGQLVGQSLFGLYKDNPDAISHVRRAMQGETLVEEIEISGKVYETHYSPLKDDDGHIAGVVGISTDIHDRWEADQQRVYLLKLADALRPLSDPREIKIKAMQVLGEHLKVSRCYYAEIIDDGEHCVIDNSYHSGIGSLDGTYRLEDFGKTHVDTLRSGKAIVAEDVSHDTKVSEAERQMNLMLQIHAYVNIPLAKDGRLICLLGVNQSAPRRWTSLQLALVTETAERTWAAVERARAEAKIQQSEKQFKDIIEAIPQLVWVCDAAGEAIYFNEQWYQFTGSTADESLGLNWVALLAPEDVGETIEKWNEAQRTAAPLIVEYRLRTREGKFRWVLARAVPIHDIQGRVARWFGTCTDIHERKTFAQELEKKVEERTIELQESNHLLQRSNEELKQFAYISSHDLQEPLRKIRTFASMALEQIKEPDVVAHYLTKISSSAERMSTLMKDILRFSQASERVLEFESVDLNELMESVKVDFELLIQQKEAAIEYDTLPSVKGNRIQLTQLLSNLLSNALKFCSTKPLVAVRYRSVSGSQIEYAKDSIKGRYHYLCFSDNGIGFNADHADQIFKLFTRLHNEKEYKGTGIGLALCKKIVENHNGLIHATSQPGRGSSFHIYLPEDHGAY